MKRRVIDRSPQLRVDGDKNTIVGYAAVFYRDDDPGTEYRFGKRYRERISREAFADFSDHDVMGRYNHDRLLARTSSGTLRLSIDDVGLRYEIDAPNHAADVVEMLERGDLRGSSFAFDIEKESREETPEGDVIFTIERASPLYDVGPVDQPAYEATQAALRSDPRFQEDPKPRRDESEAVRVRLKVLEIQHDEETALTQ